MTDLPAPSSIRRDVISAYAATAAKIASWVVALGLIYRFVGPAEFAMLSLIRGTIGILNYTTLGLSPAMIRMLAEARSAKVEHESAKPQAAEMREGVLSYFNPAHDLPVQTLYANGLLIALVCGAIGLLITLGYAGAFGNLYYMPDRLRPDMFEPVVLIGLGTLLRLMSDAPGSLLQAHGMIERDNWYLVEAETGWMILSIASVFVFGHNRDEAFILILLFHAVTGAFLLLRRMMYARQLTGLLIPASTLIDRAIIRQLVAFGSLVLFAQLADYLYAPCDYILINLFLGWDQVAAYTPAMTIDSGLLLLVAGLSSVILPRSALAHTSGQSDVVRRYYIYGTLGSAFLLMCAAAFVWLLAPWIFRIWFGNPMIATQAILPLVLIHTVVGGSSAVGRSILLGMGKVRWFTISVLAAGTLNVILSYIFVRHLHLGLRGIVYGTIIAVCGRCLLWMPWYVLRTLRPK